ncbi:MAG TPA: hypothetical protein VLJ76_12080 [Gaiellaceae bacterium]|nr:hypothetical protein [Gaiellaceae bacterium]
MVAVGLVLLCGSGTADRLRARLAGHGFVVTPPPGWRARIVAPGPPSPPALNVGNFPLPDWRDDSGNSAPVNWPAHGILITVADWTSDTSPSFRRWFRRADLPLHLTASERSGPLEGDSPEHAYFGANVKVRGRLFDVEVQIGSARAPLADLARANAVLRLTEVSARR